MELFLNEARKLKHREISVRFGAVQELCRQAPNLEHSSLSELVVLPILEMLCEEDDHHVVEASLWWLSKVVNTEAFSTKGFMLCFEKNNLHAQLLLSCVGRHPNLHRQTFRETAALDFNVLELIFSAYESPDEALQTVAHVLLIQLRLEQQTGDKRSVVLFGRTNGLLRLVRDPLMARRMIALSDENCSLLPCVDTLCDPDAFIATRAMGRLVAAKSAGDALIVNALTSDRPEAVVTVFNGLLEHSELGRNRILENKLIPALTLLHLQPGLTYTRRAAMRCLMVQAKAFLSAHAGLVSGMLEHAWDDDEEIVEALIHFVYAHAEDVLDSGVDVLPLLIAAIRDRAETVAHDAMETLAAHAEKILVNNQSSIPLLTELLRHHIVWNWELSLSASKAIVALGPEAATQVPELIEQLLFHIKSTDDGARLVSAQLLCALGPVAVKIDPKILHKVAALVPLHQFHSDVNDWPVRMLMSQFLEESRTLSVATGEGAA